jgi:hypothetical protein
VRTPFKTVRQYAFDCSKLPVEVFFIGGKLGSGGHSLAKGEAPNISYLFHALDFGDERAATFSHPCLDDTYEGRMVIKDQATFEWSWRVNGPNKDGTIRTDYRRVAPCRTRLFEASTR